MTIAAARWDATLQEKHPPLVTYLDGAIIVNVSNKDFAGVETAEWDMLKEIVKGIIVEVAIERPACAGGVNTSQSLREKTVRTNLLAYYVGS